MTAGIGHAPQSSLNFMEISLKILGASVHMLVTLIIMLDLSEDCCSGHKCSASNNGLVI